MKRKKKRKGSKLSRERRQHPRLTLSASVAYRVVKFPSPVKMIKFLDSMRRASARNISRGGVCIISRQLLPPGTTLELSLPRTNLHDARHVRAGVVWVHEIKEGKYRIGLKFS